MLKLKRLIIEEFALLPGPIELHFSEGENVLLGINGTGKTTLLELIRCCLSLDFSTFLESMSLIKLKYTLFNDEANVDVEVSLKKTKIPPLPKELSVDFAGQKNEYDIKINIAAQLEDKNVSLSVDNDTYSFGNGKNRLDRIISASPGLQIPGKITRTKLMHIYRQLNKNDVDEWREVILFFRRLLHAINRFPEGDIYFTDLHNNTEIEVHNDEEGILLSVTPSFLELEVFKSILSKQKSPENFIITNKESKILNEIKTILGFESLKISFDFKGKETIEIIETDHWKGFKLIIDIDEKTTITHEKLSYGERRFISLMFYLNSCEDVFIVDEPVNGLHHRLIDRIVDIITAEGKQCFIANQNSILFDYIHFNTPEEVRNKLILCTKEDRKMHWRNPTGEEAAELFKEIEKDFLHFSEILKMKKLW